MPWCRCGARRTGGRRSARPGRRNTRETQTPKRGLGFPSTWERERERERKKKKERQREKRRRRTSTTARERKRGQRTPMRTRGRSWRAPKQTTSRPQRPKIPYKQTKHISRKHRTKNQSPIKQSLGGIITAGWRGPWAALHFWGDTPGDRSTEGSEDPPTTGTAPGSARAGMLPDTKRRPQKCCPSTWPFLKYRTRPQITKQTQNDNRANMKPKHDRATKPTHFPVTRSRKNVVRGAPRGGGWAPPPRFTQQKSKTEFGLPTSVAFAWQYGCLPTSLSGPRFVDLRRDVGEWGRLLHVCEHPALVLKFLSCFQSALPSMCRLIVRRANGERSRLVSWIWRRQPNELPHKLRQNNPF